MKVLSVRQPWAWLIAHGVKDIENRTWRTNHRGILLIHASKTWDQEWMGSEHMFTWPQWKTIPYEDQRCLLAELKIHTSAIIGQVEVVDCVQNYSSVWAENGMWNWVLEKPILYETPILNVKGKLRLWDVETKEISK